MVRTWNNAQHLHKGWMNDNCYYYPTPPSPSPFLHKELNSSFIFHTCPSLPIPTAKTSVLGQQTFIILTILFQQYSNQKQKQLHNTEPGVWVVSDCKITRKYKEHTEPIGKEEERANWE